MAMSFKPLMDFIRVLSWQKLAQATIFVILIISAWAFWENRATIYNSLKVGARVESDEPLVIQLSRPTQAYLETTLARSKDTIAAIQIINVNFKKNSRSSAYFIFNDAELKNAYNIFAESKLSDIPLFTESEINNQRLINLINGDFVCIDFKDAPSSKIYPNVAKNISTVCSISIPPYYGRFSGFLNIYLIKKPQNEELVYIRQLSRDISLRIYELDIDKTNQGKN